MPYWDPDTLSYSTGLHSSGSLTLYLSSGDTPFRVLRSLSRSEGSLPPLTGPSILHCRSSPVSLTHRTPSHHPLEAFLDPQGFFLPPLYDLHGHPRLYRGLVHNQDSIYVSSLLVGGDPSKVPFVTGAPSRSPLVGRGTSARCPGTPGGSGFFLNSRRCLSLSRRGPVSWVRRTEGHPRESGRRVLLFSVPPRPPGRRTEVSVTTWGVSDSYRRTE